MKAAKLIKQLQKIVDKHGDLELTTDSGLTVLGAELIKDDHDKRVIEIVLY